MIVSSVATERAALRRVHLLRPGGPACGDTVPGLYAIDAHGSDKLERVNCPACRKALAHGCEIQAVTAI